jgi:hypothetical protein
VGGVILIMGFFSGRAFQHAKTGYHYRLLEQKEYASGLGPIQWTCFLESVGMPFLDTEKTMISMGNRTIYKAQRDFQESAANGSQPFSSDTNRTSSAAGSRR